MLGASILVSGCTGTAKNLTVASKTADGNKKEETSSGNAEVLVIGAGIAGLAAARELRSAGYKVVILEGRDRIGGRLWTDRSCPDFPFDRGASWIHGIRGNPIADMAKHWNIAGVPFDYDSKALYGSDGTLLSDEEIDRIYERFDGLMTYLEDIREGLEEDSRMSMKQAFDRWIDGVRLSESERTGLDYAINTEIEHEYAADISELSLLNGDWGREREGGDTLITGGYGGIAAGLAEDLDIRLGHLVRRIEWDRNHVNVITNRARFRADRVVVTLPLGVLKSGNVIFSPELPETKRRAIRNIGMGVLNKLYLRFPEPFWDENSSMLGYISQIKGEWAEFVNLAKYTGQPALVGFSAAANARMMEKGSDERVVASAMDVLRTIYGEDIPDPTGWKITRWGTDPFAYGSYSFMAPGASGKDIEELARPVGGRLFFAGEATSGEYAATVHGAYFSGIREAKRIGKLER
nr:FAD-dependent oxidoreductase [Cohnella sp. CFH 77786]